MATLYHNPGCSKSRGALALLRERDADVELIEYIATPPDRATLERLLDLLPDPPSELVRRDATYRELGLAPDDCRSRERVVEVLLAHPKLMQRPIFVAGGRAVIARPPEKLLELL